MTRYKIKKTRTAHDWVNLFILTVCLFVAALLLVGCGGLAGTEIVKHPDAPMLILDGRGTLRVAVYDAEKNELIEYGSIDAAEVHGWTLSKYDWDRATSRNN